MNTKELLGKRIKELRKAKGLNQESLAEKINVEPTSISNIECGRNYPNISTLEKILEVLESNFIEVFNFQHIDNKSVLADKIKSYIDCANQKDIEFIYKTIINLEEFKVK